MFLCFKSYLRLHVYTSMCTWYIQIEQINLQHYAIRKTQIKDIQPSFFHLKSWIKISGNSNLFNKLIYLIDMTLLELFHSIQVINYDCRRRLCFHEKRYLEVINPIKVICSSTCEIHAGLQDYSFEETRNCVHHNKCYNYSS